MVAQVKAWGNSQGIRLSKELLALDKQHRTLEERAKEYGGKLGPYQEFDWGEPVGRERW